MKVSIICLFLFLACFIGSTTEQYYRYGYARNPSYYRMYYRRPWRYINPTYRYYRMRLRPWRLTYYQLKPPPHVNHPPPPRPRARLVYKAKQQPRKPRWPDVLIQWTLPWIG